MCLLQEPTATSVTVSELNTRAHSTVNTAVLDSTIIPSDITSNVPPSATRLPMSEYTDYNPPSESQLFSAIEKQSRASSCVNSTKSATTDFTKSTTGCPTKNVSKIKEN